MLKIVKPLSVEEAKIEKVLQHYSQINLAIIFGSVAKETATRDSDLDIAVSFQEALDANTKINIMSALAELTGRPIDLVDLHDVGEPLLGQILLYGKVIVGNQTQVAKLLSRHLIDSEDFMFYQSRILAERRAAWISN